MTPEFLNPSSKRLSLRDWIKRYPGRAAGWAYLPPALAMGASGAFQCLTGDVWSGASLLAAAAFECVGDTALIRYADPEITADKAAGHVDIQDQGLWARMTSPRLAPHEFSGNMLLFSTAGLVASAMAQQTPSSIIMAASCVFGTVASLVAEKEASQTVKPDSLLGHFNALAAKPLHWIQKKPNNAMFWFFLPCNVAQVFNGWNHVNAVTGAPEVDGMMIASGIGYAAVNFLRAQSSKRTKVVAELA